MISDVCFSPDDSQVFVSFGEDVVIFNVADGEKVDEFEKVYKHEVNTICFSSQGENVILELQHCNNPTEYVNKAKHSSLICSQQGSRFDGQFFAM